MFDSMFDSVLRALDGAFTRWRVGHGGARRRRQAAFSFLLAIGAALPELARAGQGLSSDQQIDLWALRTNFCVIREEIGVHSALTRCNGALALAA